MSDSGLNPTAEISVDFGAFLDGRTRELSNHTSKGGIADYAFGLDHALRQRIASLALARHAVRTISTAIGPIQRYIHNMEMVAVGPRQLPHIHQHAERCARMLGIGVPQIFVASSPILNAYTFATDDSAPFLVCSSGLIETLEPNELVFVIGHECGHIHNLHGAYNTAVQQLTNPLAKLLCSKLSQFGAACDLLKTANHVKTLSHVISGALRMFFLSWSRAAEVTCDRAGFICCGDLRAAETALMKIATGGATALEGINVDVYLEQLEQTRSSPLRVLEFFGTHPLLPKRIRAVRAFASCDTYFSWYPGADRPAETLSKQQVDEFCRGILGIAVPAAEQIPDTHRAYAIDMGK